jgi:hypothetical protein
MAEERKKEKSRGFAALGIPVGSILVYKKDPSITVKTLDGGNKVEYQGKPYSISTLAKQLVGSPVSGYLYFKYKDKVIKSISISEAKPPTPSGATETAKAAEVTEVAETAEVTGVAEELTGEDMDPLAGAGGEGDTAVCAGDLGR